MRKISSIISLVAVATLLVSCGGSKPAKQATVSLGPLDDFFTVKSYTIESDAEEKGLEKLDKVKGTLTVVAKRNETEMKYKPSDIDYARVGGEISSSSYYVFRGDCDAVIRKMVKMEPKSEETFTIGFKGVDPYNQFNSEEYNAANRQNAFDALTKKGCLDQICFEVEFVEDENEAVKALKALKDLAEDLDDLKDDD